MTVIIPKEKSKLDYDLRFDNSDIFGSLNIRFEATKDYDKLTFAYSSSIKLIATNVNVGQEELTPLVKYIDEKIDFIRNFCDNKIEPKKFVELMSVEE